MSIRATVRRFGVPAVAVGSIAVPVLLAGCPQLERPPWYGFPGCEECSDCYDAFVGSEPPEERSTFGEPAPERLGELPAGEGGKQDSEGEPESDGPPSTGPRPRIPDAVLRPRVDPGRNVPKSPSKY